MRLFKFVAAFLFMSSISIGGLSTASGATNLNVGPSLPPVTNTNSVKSYREWKGEKVQSATAQLISIRSLVQKAKSENNSKSLDSLEKHQSQMQWNLEVANDLSVADYFVLYLSQQNQTDRFQQAAQKLTTSEVAELLEAYSGVISGGSTESAKLPQQAIQIRDQIK